MRYHLILSGVLAAMFSSSGLAQSTEYFRRLSGTVDVSAAGQVSTYSLQSAGVPAIDQSLGSLVESWSFQPQKGLVTQLPYKADVQITVVRTGMEDKNYSVKRVEFKPQKSALSVRAPVTPEEMAYCQQADATPRKDIICPAVMPNDPLITAGVINAEAYIALRRTESGPQAALESLYLFSTQNGKLISKSVPPAKLKYSQAALDWANKNAVALLQDREYALARVEFALSNNKSPWRRQEKVETGSIDWFTDAVRAKTVYVGQGGMELK
jgi:hypothetical protein